MFCELHFSSVLPSHCTLRTGKKQSIKKGRHRRKKGNQRRDNGKDRGKYEREDK
jgi:hypothetical protein